MAQETKASSAPWKKSIDLDDDLQECENLSDRPLLLGDGHSTYETPSFLNTHKGFMLIFSLSCLLLSGVVVGAFMLLWVKNSSQPQHQDLDRICLERQSYYSPALKDISPILHEVRFNGTLDHPSEYRGAPNPRIDAAWDRLENVRVMSISEEQLLSSGFSSDSVKLPTEYGGGFMASLEVNHQLHCLNFLRKGLHREYYQFKSAEFTDRPEMVQTHLDHCIEMLRQNLMCHADVGVMAHRWVKHYKNPYPDFNVIHKCRDFEQVLKWTYDHQTAETPTGHRWQPGPDDKIWDSPP